MAGNEEHLERLVEAQFYIPVAMWILVAADGSGEQMRECLTLSSW